MIFQKAITAVRYSQGWTMDKMAMACRVKPRTYQAWEAGRATPPLEKIMEIAQTFGMTTSEFLGEVKAKAPKNDPGHRIKFLPPHIKKLVENVINAETQANTKKISKNS